MKDLLALSSEFEKLATESTQVVKIAAGRKNRNRLAKELEHAKKFYTAHCSSLANHERAAKDLAAVIDREKKEVERTRSDINRAYDALKNLDIHGADEVRFMADDIVYIKGRRGYRLDKDQLVPWKKKKEEELDLDVDDSEDAEMSADDLLASLVD